MKFYIHFTANQREGLPGLDKWDQVEADSYETAALNTELLKRTLKMYYPWETTIYAHVYKDGSPKWPNGMPIMCHSFTLTLEKQEDNPS